MGGERITPDKLSREQIVTLYKAGPEAVEYDAKQDIAVSEKKDPTQNESMQTRMVLQNGNCRL